MNGLIFRVVDAFPEPDYAALAGEAFADFAPSPLLVDVLAAEATTSPVKPKTDGDGALRIGVFRGQALVAWTYARREGAQHLHMGNSGVALGERRSGVYSELVRRVIDHATSLRYTAIHSRHVAGNNAVIIAKLKLGFFVSGFEYSEVYGPLVRLTYLPGKLRQSLYRTRSSPIRQALHTDAPPPA